MKTEQFFKSPCLLTLVFSTLLSGLTTAQQLTYNQSTGIFNLTPTPPTLLKPGAYYKVFVNTGEGHYFIGDLNNPIDPDPDLNNTPYWGAINGSDAYAELTTAYDDTHPPPGVYNFTPSSTIPATGTPPLLTFTGKLFMEANRSIVKDHNITFIATVKNTCTGSSSLSGTFTFTYDAGMFDPVSVMPATISGLPAGQQKSVFFTLKTKPTVVLGTSPAIPPRVNFASSAGSPCSIEDAYEMTGMTVLPSHDPNHKYANLELISQNGEEMIYQVTFQNDGPGTEYYVVVNDELDPYLKNQVPEVLSPYPAELVNPPFPVFIAPRTWQWRFDFNGTPGLRGTKEQGYLTQFHESDTKRSFKFKVKLDTFAPCNAVLNRATIYFKCQAPIETELSMVPIPCVQGDSIDTCSVVSDVWLPGWSGIADGAPLPALLSSAWFSLNNYDDPNVGWRYKWYPSENVTAAWQLNPGLKMARTGVYVLVISHGCRRHIFRIPVTTTAGVQTGPILVQDNPNDCVARLFISGGTPPYNVAWTFTNSNGSPGTATGTFLDLAGKTGIQATVTDSQGCSVVFTPIATNCNSWPCWATWAAIIAAIIAGIIWFLKKSKKFSL